MSEQKQSSRKLLIIGLLVAMLFSALQNTIVSTAMPRIIGDLGGFSLMVWLSTAYMLSSTVVVPITGKIADLWGRKTIYITGILIFMIGSILCGTANSMEQLIAYRVIQGIGGGIMMPMAMIIIGDIFTGAQRAKWQGVFGGVFALASVIGPQIGGWIVDSWDWHWVFFINLPIGFIALFLISISLHNHRSKGPIVFDWGGMVTLILAVVPFLLGLTMGGKDYEWVSWQIFGLFGFSFAFFIVFVMIERKAKEPLLPLSLFKNKTFTVLNGVSFLMSVGMFGATMFIPLYLQGIIGVSPTESGTAMIPMMMSMLVTSIIGGRLVQKVGIRNQIIAGMILIAASFFLLSHLSVDSTKWIVVRDMILLGLGIGLVNPIVTLALQESFPKSQLGVVTSSSQFFRQIGGTFGMTVLGAVMNSRSSTLLHQDFIPKLDHLPAQAAPMVTQMKDMIETSPQGLYSSLLSPDLLKKIPQTMQDALFPTLKTTLVQSLEIVFLSGLGFILVGLVLSFFIGKIQISGDKKKKA